MTVSLLNSFTIVPAVLYLVVMYFNNPKYLEPADVSMILKARCQASSLETTDWYKQQKCRHSMHTATLAPGIVLNKGPHMAAWPAPLYVTIYSGYACALSYTQ